VYKTAEVMSFSFIIVFVSAPFLQIFLLSHPLFIPRDNAFTAFSFENEQPYKNHSGQ
jgi:hypothetical protein